MIRARLPLGASFEVRFEHWLAEPKTLVGFNAENVLARDVAAGRVDLRQTDSYTYNRIIEARVVFRAVEERQAKARKRSAPKRRATTGDVVSASSRRRASSPSRRGGRCPGCQRETDEVRVNAKSGSRTLVQWWHGSCRDKKLRGSSNGQGRTGTARNAGLRTTNAG